MSGTWEGNWVIKEAHFIGYDIKEQHHQVAWTASKEIATLIAAAPELLEACQAVLNNDIPIELASQLCLVASIKVTQA